MEREIEALKVKLAAKDMADLVKKVKKVKGISVLAAVVDATDAKTMRDLGDRLKDKIKSGIILLGSKAGR